MAKDYTPQYKDRVVFGIGVRGLIQNNGLEKFLDTIKRKRGSRELLGKLADRYLAFIHRTHSHKANGIGDWRRLSETTKRLRTAKDRQVKFTRSVESILIDTGQLYGATAPNGRGQVRRLDVSTLTARVGISGTDRYYEPRHVNRARRSLGQLVRWHEADGRAIIIPPNERTQQEMVEDARNWVRSLRVT